MTGQTSDNKRRKIYSGDVPGKDKIETEDVVKFQRNVRRDVKNVRKDTDKLERGKAPRAIPKLLNHTAGDVAPHDMKEGEMRWIDDAGVQKLAVRLNGKLRTVNLT